MHFKHFQTTPAYHIYTYFILACDCNHFSVYFYIFVRLF